jgi:hypothetical protein
MGNVRLIFGGTEISNTIDHSLQVYVNYRNELFISIDMEDYPEAFICLDRSTAIKLSREIRKQIALMEE